MATYRVTISRPVSFIERAQIDIELPSPPHPTDETVQAEIWGIDIPWDEGAYVFGDTKIEKVEGLIDEEDEKDETIFPVT